MGDPRPGMAYWGKPRKTLTASRNEAWERRPPPRARVRLSPIRCVACGRPDTFLVPLVCLGDGWCCSRCYGAALDAVLAGRPVEAVEASGKRVAAGEAVLAEVRAERDRLLAAIPLI